jgi:hypothetical protein
MRDGHRAPEARQEPDPKMKYEADKTRASKVISPESLTRDYLLVPDAPTGPSIVADSEGELWMVLTEDEEGVLLAPAKGSSE